MTFLSGAHYTYSAVPFGFTLQEWFGASRNMYDRLVHFAFGFLLAYPIREAFMRVARVRGVWGFYLPFDVTLAFSAAYEIIEWCVATRVKPEAGLAFLGSQGDAWDAQKDMLAAAVGAALTLLVVALINWRYNPAFLQELKESLLIPRGDKPLGEVQANRRAFFESGGVGQIGDVGYVAGEEGAGLGEVEGKHRSHAQRHEYKEPHSELAPTELL